MSMRLVQKWALLLVSLFENFITASRGYHSVGQSVITVKLLVNGQGHKITQRDN